MNVPEKHRAVAKAWVDGAQIETLIGLGEWVPWPHPHWRDDLHYRIKPKAKVKKWRWVYRDERTGCLEITGSHVSEDRAKGAPYLIQKIDSTMIEVDE